jgi:hypothetical protein
VLVRRKFWKATLISLGGYAVAPLIGVLVNFRFALFAVLALQFTWTLFCIVRMIQLRGSLAHEPDAPLYDRESYGFAVGGTISSLALLLGTVVLTQIV